MKVKKFITLVSVMILTVCCCFSGASAYSSYKSYVDISQNSYLLGSERDYDSACKWFYVTFKTNELKDYKSDISSSWWSCKVSVNRPTWWDTNTISYKWVQLPSKGKVKTTFIAYSSNTDDIAYSFDTWQHGGFKADTYMVNWSNSSAGLLY